MKKAQISQVFIYISAALIIGVTIIVGVYFLSKTTATVDVVDLVNFKKTMDDDVRNIYNFAYGTSNSYSMRLPSGVSGICFLEVSQSLNLGNIPFDNIRDVANVLKEGGGTSNNLFFESDELLDNYRIENLKPANGMVCLKPVNGKINFRLENMGKYVEIKEI